MKYYVGLDGSMKETSICVVDETGVVQSRYAASALQLFDYLALELSPTYNGDRLITIELGRSADGMTTAPWTPTVFEADRAIAA